MRENRPPDTNGMTMTSIFSASSAVRAKRSMASFAASWASTHRRAKGAKARPASVRCTFLPDRSNRSTPNSFSSACTALLSPCCEIYSLRAARENEPNWAISRKYLRDSMRMRPPAFRPMRPMVIIANPGPFRRARTLPVLRFPPEAGRHATTLVADACRPRQ